MSIFKDIKFVVDKSAEEIDELEGTPSYAVMLTVGLAVSTYVAGSLSYFAYKGGKALLKHLGNQ